MAVQMAVFIDAITFGTYVALRSEVAKPLQQHWLQVNWIIAMTPSLMSQFGK